MKNKKTKLSAISKLHYSKLVLRSLLFLGALAAYAVNRANGSGSMFGGYDGRWLWITVFAVYAVEMVLRCFPSDYESMGCQKQFKKNFIPVIPDRPADRKALRASSWKSTVPVLVSWVLLNLLLIWLYEKAVFDWGIMILISLFYSVCDMICILFFCPFQTWMMKNKCCGSCRIYNWDYIMMFTPLTVVDNPFARGLVALSLLLLLRWELCYNLYPERFYEETNGSLSCANCREKLCHHKKQLRSFHRKLFKELQGIHGAGQNAER